MHMNYVWALVNLLVIMLGLYQLREAREEEHPAFLFLLIWIYLVGSVILLPINLFLAITGR